MKVIITESKFDKATQSYLTMLFDGIQVEKSTPLPGRDVYFYDDITEPVFVLFNKKELYLYEEYARQIFNMFSMKSWEEIEEIILKWFRNHYKIKVDYLYTFDDPEHTYSM